MMKNNLFKKCGAALNEGRCVSPLGLAPLPPSLGGHGPAAMRPDSHDIEAVIRQALLKYEKGRLELGQLDLSSDPRNFIDESIEEMLDAINYLTFQIIRLRSIRDVQ